MKKVQNELTNKLRYLCLFAVIVLGLITIIGTSGSSEILWDVDDNEGNDSKTYILNIKGEINQTEDYFGDVRYFGEVENTGTGVASFVKITVTTYDSEDNVIGVNYTYIYGNLYIYSNEIGLSHALGPNEYGSFEVITDVPYDSVARYSTSITYSTFNITQPNISLAVSGNITEHEDSSGDREYLGEIINNGGGTASFVEINFTMKNSSNLVIGTDFTYINGHTCTIDLTGTTIDTCLAPSDKGSFEENTSIPALDIASYYYRIYHDEYAVSGYSSLVVDTMAHFLINNFSTLTHDEKIIMRNEIIEDLIEQIESREPSD